MESSPITAYSIVTEQPVRLKTCLDPVPPLPTKRDVIEDCCTCACCYGSLPDWGKRDDPRSRRSSLGSCSSANDVDNYRKDERDHIHVEDSFTSIDGHGDSGDKSEGFDANWWSREERTNDEHFNSDGGDCFSNDHGGCGDNGDGGDYGSGGDGGGGE